MILRRLLPLLLLLAVGRPAAAAVTITFYSHDLGSSFPHAFVLLRGTPDAGGVPVDANYGFTAKRITPAILKGSVQGDIESANPVYVAHSQPHWRMVLSDGQYAAALATIEQWRAIPGRSYDLKRRNCVHFVADLARTLGMTVVETRKLMGKPRSFLDDVYRRNEALKLVAASADAVPILAAPAYAAAPASLPAALPAAAPLAQGPGRPGADLAPAGAAVPRAQ